MGEWVQSSMTKKLGLRWAVWQNARPMLKLRTWFACAILGSQGLQAAPEISVQRWEGEELTSTGGVQPISYRGTSSVQLPWISLDALICALG